MTKEELKQYGRIDNEILYIRDKIHELENKKSSIGKVLTDNQVTGNSADNYKLIRIMEKIDKQVKKYWNKYDNLLEQLNKIEEAIDKLDSLERTIMRLRYIDGLSWENVALKVEYSWPQLMRIHKNILIKIS